MKFKKYFISTGLIGISVYLTLLLIQISVSFFTNTTNSVETNKSVSLELCPADKHLKYYFFESMGRDLIRRQDVGWLLNPKTIGNPKGYLGDCFPYKKDKETKRVVFLGDSFTGAIQVPYEKTFVRRVQSKLQEKYPSKNIEAINLGIGGYGTDQEYFTLINEAVRYSPNIICHIIFLGNDIKDNSYNLYVQQEHPRHRKHPIKRYITFNEKGALVYHEPDLEYYYEMNMADFFGSNNWVFNVFGEDYLVTFKYDNDQSKLLGSLLHQGDNKLFDLIDKVSFFDDYPFSLHLEKTNIWLHGNLIDTNLISGVVGENKNSLWIGIKQYKKKHKTKSSFRLWNFIHRHVMLLDLRKFVKDRLFRNYSVGFFLLKHMDISKKDEPIFYKLMKYQGKYPFDYRIFFKEYDDPEWEKAWEVTFRLIKKMRDFSEHTLNVPYIVYTIPSMEMVYADYWESAQLAYPELKKVARSMDVMKPTNLMDNFLTDENIFHLSFFNLLKDQYRKKNNKLYDSKHAHFNVAGHEFVASHIANTIIRNNLLNTNIKHNDNKLNF